MVSVLSCVGDDTVAGWLAILKGKNGPERARRHLNHQAHKFKVDRRTGENPDNRASEGSVLEVSLDQRRLPVSKGEILLTGSGAHHIVYLF
jgi:hypothetical protein